MEKDLARIGLNPKEAKVYLYLVEYGTSPASEIAKNCTFPKSSVNFMADSLYKRGLLRKSLRWNTQYYEADISLLETSLLEEMEEKKHFLEQTLPELREKNRNTRSAPKILFIEGRENCKKAYLEILKTKDVFYEFGAHADLAEAFGETFMDNFIQERVKKNIFCDSIGTYGPMEAELQKSDTEQLRDLTIFPESFGTIGSSVAVYDNKVLILNLRGADRGIRIENSDFSETMKTLFRICKKRESALPAT